MNVLKALNDIVLMINEFNFKDDSGHDILGDVYEYLIWPICG